MAADKPSVREMYRAMVDDPVSVYRHVGRGEFHVHRRVFDCVATSADPRVVHHVLVANAANYRKTPIARSLLEPILGRGLLTSEGDFWRRQRRIEAPAFHRKRIEAFADVMTELAHDMTESWESAAESGEPLDLQSEMSRVTMKIIVRAMFSDRLDEAEAHGVSEAMRALDRHRLRFRDFIGVPEWLPRRRDPAVRAAVGAIDRTVNRIIAERRAQGEDRGDLLSMMMLAEDAETGERMTDRQLRDETITIFLAGHETTATALVWTFYALHRFPEVEARLHAEVDSALGNAPPRLADLANLSWTRMTVEETMRLYPTVAMLSRQAVAGDEILGVRVPPPDDYQPQYLACAPQPGELARPGTLRPRTFRFHPPARAAEARLFPVRQRPSHLHRQRLRDDGGPADPGRGRPPLAPARRRRPRAPRRGQCRPAPARRPPRHSRTPPRGVITGAGAAVFSPSSRRTEKVFGSGAVYLVDDGDRHPGATL